MRRGKYITVEIEDGPTVAIMAHEAVSHEQMRNGLPDFWKTITAGFFIVRVEEGVLYIDVEGRSQSLNLESDPEFDPKHIARAMGVEPRIRDEPKPVEDISSDRPFVIIKASMTLEEVDRAYYTLTHFPWATVRCDTTPEGKFENKQFTGFVTEFFRPVPQEHIIRLECIEEPRHDKTVKHLVMVDDGLEIAQRKFWIPTLRHVRKMLFNNSLPSVNFFNKIEGS